MNWTAAFSDMWSIHASTQGASKVSGRGRDGSMCWWLILLYLGWCLITKLDSWRLALRKKLTPCAPLVLKWFKGLKFTGSDKTSDSVRFNIWQWFCDACLIHWILFIRISFWSRSCPPSSSCAWQLQVAVYKQVGSPLLYCVILYKYDQLFKPFSAWHISIISSSHTSVTYPEQQAHWFEIQNQL